jgi:hypothetical protein
VSNLIHAECGPRKRVPISKTERGRVFCPRCAAPLSISKSLFRQGLRCSGCQTKLHVSVVYSRTLVFLSAVVSLGLLWIAGIRNLWLFVLYLPVGAVILSVAVRVVPFIVRPPLCIGQPTVFVELDLK